MSHTIIFPALGVTMHINRVAFPLFGKDIYWYGIIIAIGFILGVALALRRAKKMDIDQDVVFDLVIWGLPAAIICARIYYVIGDWSNYQFDFMKMIAIWDGGIAIYGAIIGAALVGIIYSRRKRLNMGKVFDLAAPSLMVGQIVGRLGNFMNAEVYGGMTSLPWGMHIVGQTSGPVHPLFMYEQVWMLAGLIGLLIYEKYKKRNGEMFVLYILWYSLGRIWMELLRQNEYVLRIGDPDTGIPLSLATAVALAVTAAAALVWLYAKKRRGNNDLS